MLLVKSVASPALSPALAILTTVSLPVLATNSALSSWLKSTPLAPNGGKPVVSRSGADFHATPSPPEIGRAHVSTPVTDQPRLPSSACKKKTSHTVEQLSAT